MKKLILLILAILATSKCLADSPSIYDSQNGKYLGKLGGSQYDADSTNNPYGQYGSKYSADSINNPYGQYGSKYSNDSPNNPYSTNQPVIIDRDNN
ncbi:hypothetical protein [Methylobacter tundripaludum]|uniref:hypothetical protein n=1 Tax=Methylobacter tundripaludum TaxID=173365 RepID=UPI0009DD8F88|nr:hypothetical protein [Methylobacter tundripaludum]